MPVQVSISAQGFIKGCLEAGRPSPARPHSSPKLNNETVKTTDVVKTYTSRLQALQEKYGFKADDPEGATTSQEEAASSVPQVTDQYQDRLRQLQQQYGISKTTQASPETKPSSLDSIRARMQKLDSSGAHSPEPAEPKTASSIEELKARLNKVLRSLLNLTMCR